MYKTISREGSFLIFFENIIYLSALIMTISPINVPQTCLPIS